MIQLDRKEIEKDTSDFRKHRETRWNQLTEKCWSTNWQWTSGKERWKWTELYPKAMWPAKSVLKLMKHKPVNLFSNKLPAILGVETHSSPRDTKVQRRCFESDLWIAVWTS